MHRPAYSEFRLNNNADHQPLHFSFRSSNTTRRLNKSANRSRMAQLPTEAALTCSAALSSSWPSLASLPPRPTATSRATQASFSSVGTQIETAAVTPLDSRTTHISTGHLTRRQICLLPSRTLILTQQLKSSSMEFASKSAPPLTSRNPFSARLLLI